MPAPSCAAAEGRRSCSRPHLSRRLRGHGNVGAALLLAGLPLAGSAAAAGLIAAAQCVAPPQGPTSNATAVLQDGLSNGVPLQNAPRSPFCRLQLPPGPAVAAGCTSQRMVAALGNCTCIITAKQGACGSSDGLLHMYAVSMLPIVMLCRTHCSSMHIVPASLLHCRRPCSRQRCPEPRRQLQIQLNLSPQRRLGRTVSLRLAELLTLHGCRG